MRSSEIQAGEFKAHKLLDVRACILLGIWRWIGLLGLQAQDKQLYPQAGIGHRGHHQDARALRTTFIGQNHYCVWFFFIRKVEVGLVGGGVLGTWIQYKGETNPSRPQAVTHESQMLCITPKRGCNGKNSDQSSDTTPESQDEGPRWGVQV